MKSPSLPLVVFMTVVVAAVSLVYGPLDPVPRLRASATSPDGSLTVKVYKKRLVLLPPRGVRVVAEVYDNRRGETVYEKTIFEDGWWHDVGWMYREIVFEADEIRIRPKHSVREYFVIKRSELRPAQSNLQP